jgi:hypothetical protein
MKKLLITTLLAGGFALGVLAQGNVALDNSANTDTSPTATSNGQFFLNNGTTTALTQGDFNAAFYGGTDANNLQLIHSFSGSEAQFSGFSGAGKWGDPNGAAWAIPGSTGAGTAFMKIEAWTGAFTTYSAALAGGAAAGVSSVFQNPMKALPDAPPTLTGMPAVVMAVNVVPEPSTFALAGLGAAALLIFRRRK